MQMYEITILSKDMKSQLIQKIVYADNEDDALNLVTEELDCENISYGVCMAEEIH